MSELKEYTADDIQELDDKRLEESESGKIDCTRVYLKSEADKVIAEQESEIRNLRRSLIVARHEVAKARGKKISNKYRAIFKEGK